MSFPMKNSRLFQIAQGIREKTQDSVSALFDPCLPGDCAPVRGRRYSGSYTVEAAWVSAVVILAVVTTIQAAYGLRGRVVQAMVLHEAVETARHEKGLTAQEVQTRFERTGVRLELQERGGIIDGQAAADRWEVRIQSTKFRPEEFLRRITLLEQLEEGNGGSL